MLTRRLFIAAGLAATILPASAAVLGDDGLHKAPWMQDTFRDLREDLAEATASGRHLLLMIEQRGCIYCTQMHEQVYPDEAITRLLSDDFFVIQINMFGDIPVTDFDGETLAEKDIVRKWRAVFTPTLIFLPPGVSDDVSAARAAAVTMQGALDIQTTTALLEWVREGGYAGGSFQDYMAARAADG
ncbi:MAG: thioredoxin family protein [Paracoccus sp. (in: a-proteobacteria)]|nr:thioredoxin family protein [Paracoccus sp. (in: a-proteobacteria)]